MRTSRAAGFAQAPRLAPIKFKEFRLLGSFSGVEWSVRWVVEVLHEQYFISSLVVDEFVDEMAGKQNAVAARRQSDGLTNLNVAHGIIEGIGDGGM
jgi:hypothetical protein